MPFKSQAQRRKFAELLVKGEISKETYEEWNRDTGSKKLPERVAHWYGLTTLEDSDYTLKVDRAHTRVRVDFTPMLARLLG